MTSSDRPGRTRIRAPLAWPTALIASTLSLVVLSGALATGCSGGDDGAGNDELGGSDDQSAAIDEGSGSGSVGGTRDGLDSDWRPRRRQVRLGLTDWTGSRINVAIAELVIERRLGYPVTTEPVRRYDEMFADLAAGQLDAVLELWPSTLSDDELASLEAGRVADLGPLGVDGRVGWYVPRYVIDEDPALASWEGFARPEVARRFITADSDGKGRFLGIDPSYEQFDEDLIAALGLDFAVVYSGSEQATRDELEAATSRRAPILVYWWSPTAEIVEYDLVKVELPVRTAECLDAYAQGRPMSCDYPNDQLIKVGTPGLSDADPELARLLSRFRLSTADQLAMIHAVEVKGRSIRAVAEEWVEGNEAEWSSWLG